MNFLMISPHFPNNFKPFAYELNKKGINVLGVGDEPYENLGEQLQKSLKEYYKVLDMEDTEEVKKAVAYLFFKHGPIDRIESHNEHWLELDAELREQFNVPGVKPEELKKTKFKSKMKEIFRQADVPVVDGLVAKSKEEVKSAVVDLNLPVVAKPDNGVGSAATYKIETEEELQTFLDQYDEAVPYFIEQAIDSARLLTYDGLIDQNGRVVFQTSLVYGKPTLEYMDGSADMAFVIQKEIDPKLEAYGKAIVKEFGMKERFFHIELFEMNDGDYIALEYNNRLAGNFSIDLYNHTHSINLFKEYASIVLGEEFEGNKKDPVHYCVGITQRDISEYKHSIKQIVEMYGDRVKNNERMPEAFSELMGNQFFAIVADTPDEVDELIAYIHERKI